MASVGAKIEGTREIRFHQTAEWGEALSVIPTSIRSFFLPETPDDLPGTAIYCSLVDITKNRAFNAKVSAHAQIAHGENQRAGAELNATGNNAHFNRRYRVTAYRTTRIEARDLIPNAETANALAAALQVLPLEINKHYYPCQLLHGGGIYFDIHVNNDLSSLGLLAKGDVDISAFSASISAGTRIGAKTAQNIQCGISNFGMVGGISFDTKVFSGKTDDLASLFRQIMPKVQEALSAIPAPAVFSVTLASYKPYFERMLSEEPQIRTPLRTACELLLSHIQKYCDFYQAHPDLRQRLTSARDSLIELNALLGEHDSIDQFRHYYSRLRHLYNELQSSLQGLDNDHFIMPKQPVHLKLHPDYGSTAHVKITVQNGILTASNEAAGSPALFSITPKRRSRAEIPLENNQDFRLFLREQQKSYPIGTFHKTNKIEKPAIVIRNIIQKWHSEVRAFSLFSLTIDGKLIRLNTTNQILRESTSICIGYESNGGNRRILCQKTGDIRLFFLDIPIGKTTQNLSREFTIAHFSFHHTQAPRWQPLANAVAEQLSTIENFLASLPPTPHKTETVARPQLPGQTGATPTSSAPATPSTSLTEAPPSRPLSALVLAPSGHYSDDSKSESMTIEDMQSIDSSTPTTPSASSVRTELPHTLYYWHQCDDKTNAPLFSSNRTPLYQYFSISPTSTANNDCGFSSLQTSRAAFQKTLLRHSHDHDYQTILAEEIIQVLVSNPQLSDTLLSTEHPKKVFQRFLALINNRDSDQDKLEQERQRLMQQCTTADAFSNYVNYLAAPMRCLGRYSAVCYAKATGQRLQIFAPKKNGAQELERQNLQATGSEPGVCMLFTNDPIGHFDVLIPQQRVLNTPARPTAPPSNPESTFRNNRFREASLHTANKNLLFSPN